MLFEAKTVQTSNIKTLFDLLKSIIVECNLIVSEDGIKIMELNTTQVALIHMKLDSSSFESFYYDKTNGEELVLGIHTDSIFKILKTVKHDETLSFSVDEKYPSNILIKKENDTRNSTNTFKVPLHSLEFKKYEIPLIEFNTSISMSSHELQRICKNFSSLGAKLLDIRTVREGVFFSSTGDFCSIEGVVGDSSETTFNSDNSSIVQGVFDIKYLLLFSKACSLSKTVDLHLKNDYPLAMCYKIGSLGELKFIISSVSET